MEWDRNAIKVINKVVYLYLKAFVCFLLHDFVVQGQFHSLKRFSQDF